MEICGDHMIICSTENVISYDEIGKMFFIVSEHDTCSISKRLGRGEMQPLDDVIADDDVFECSTFFGCKTYPLSIVVCSVFLNDDIV